jgi:glycosyltransferase involved in cell wall biosynthesis
VRISVVVTAYNLEKFIAEALESVLHQTRPADEIIVVDDCSTDGTAQVVQSFGQRVKHLKQPVNGGALLNSLSGLRQSTGDVVCMLDGDDVWALNKLETVENFFNASPNALVLSHHHERVDEKLQSLKIIDDTNQNINRILGQALSPSEQSHLLRESILNQQGYWMGSAYSFRRNCVDLARFEAILDEYPHVKCTYLDLVLVPFLVLTHPDKIVGYSAKTSFFYRVHSAGSMGSQVSQEALKKSILRGRSTNELVLLVMQRCGATKRHVETRQLIIRSYDFLSALYEGQRLKASRLFAELSVRLWTKPQFMKESARYSFISLFGMKAYLKARAVKTQWDRQKTLRSP